MKKPEPKPEPAPIVKFLKVPSAIPKHPDNTNKPKPAKKEPTTQEKLDRLNAFLNRSVSMR